MLTVINVHISSKLGEVSMSECAPGSIKGVSVTMLISIKSDLDVDTSRVLPDKCQVCDCLPHVKCLLNRFVNIGIAQAARCRVLQNSEFYSGLIISDWDPQYVLPTCKTVA